MLLLDTSRSSTSKPTHITPDISTDDLTVDQINNLATAFHYFVWPANPVDHGFTNRARFGAEMNELVEAIRYSQNLGLSSEQVDIFYCQVAISCVGNEQTFWSNKHVRISAEYTYMQDMRYQQEILPLPMEWFSAACCMQLLWNN